MNMVSNRPPQYRWSKVNHRKWASMPRPGRRRIDLPKPLPDQIACCRFYGDLYIILMIIFLSCFLLVNEFLVFFNSNDLCKFYIYKWHKISSARVKNFAFSFLVCKKIMRWLKFVFYHFSMKRTRSLFYRFSWYFSDIKFLSNKRKIWVIVNKSSILKHSSIFRNYIPKLIVYSNLQLTLWKIYR